MREVAQQNAQLPQQLSRVLAKAVKPLLDVHRTTAQKALGSSSGPALGPSSSSASGPSSGPAKGPHSDWARVRPLAQATQFSQAGTRIDNSSAAYATANESGVPGGAVEEERGALGDLQQGVEQRTARPSLIMNINVGKGTVSSASSTPSPAIAKGKDMLEFKAAVEKEKEEERRTKAARDR